MIVSVGFGELRARGKTGAKCCKKEGEGEDKRPERRAWKNRDV